MADQLSLTGAHWNDRLRTFAVIMLVEDTLRPVYRYLASDEVLKRYPELGRNFRAQVKQTRNDVETPNEGDPLEYLPLTTLLDVHIGTKKPSDPKDEPLQKLFRPRSRAARTFVSNLEVLVGIRNSVCHGRQVNRDDFSTALKVGSELLELLDDVLQGYPITTLGRPAEFVEAFLGSVSCCFQDQFEMDGLRFCLVRDSRSPFAYRSDALTLDQWCRYKGIRVPSEAQASRPLQLKDVANDLHTLDRLLWSLRDSYKRLSKAEGCASPQRIDERESCGYCCLSYPSATTIEIHKLAKLKQKRSVGSSDIPIVFRLVGPPHRGR